MVIPPDSRLTGLPEFSYAARGVRFSTAAPVGRGSAIRGVKVSIRSCFVLAAGAGRILGLAVLLVLSAPAHSDHPGFEFIAFPTVVSTNRSGLPDTVALESRENEATINLFVSAQYESLRLLAERDVSGAGHGATQRLQLGWHWEPHWTFWLGRYHAPLGFWNTEYHHGLHLQTSTSRPGIAAFEGGDGPVPMHFTGGLLEGRVLGSAGDAWGMQFGYGYSARLEDRLKPVDVSDIRTSEHDTGAALRIAYYADATRDTQVGVSLGQSDMPLAAEGESGEVRQQQVSLFVDWHLSAWRFISEWTHVDTELIADAGSDSSRFDNLYLQVERSLGQSITGYARVETSRNADNVYLDRFDQFVRERQLAGVRYDFERNQAITLEYARVERLPGRYQQLTLQWSAYLP